MCTNWESVPLPLGALHKKSWAVIDRPYSLGFATVGALYERPRYISCAKHTSRTEILERNRLPPLFSLQSECPLLVVVPKIQLKNSWLNRRESRGYRLAISSYRRFL